MRFFGTIQNRWSQKRTLTVTVGIDRLKRYTGEIPSPSDTSYNVSPEEIRTPDEFVEDSGESDDYPKRDPLRVTFAPTGEIDIEDMRDTAARETAPQGGNSNVPPDTSRQSRDDESARDRSAVDANIARNRSLPTNDPSQVPLPQSSPGELATPMSYSHLDVALPSETTGSRTAEPFSSGDVTLPAATTPLPKRTHTPPTPPERPQRTFPRQNVKRSRPESSSSSDHSIGEAGKLTRPHYNLRKRGKSADD